MTKVTWVAIALFAGACTKTAEKSDPAPGSGVRPATPIVRAADISITTTSPAAKTAFESGMALMVVARLDEAAPLFQQALELDGEFAQAHAMLGAVTPGAEGIALLDKAMTLAAGLPEAERQWILAFQKQRSGDPAGASAAWHKVIKLAPMDWRAYTQLGLIANITGDHANARAMFEKVLTIKPDLAVAFNGLAYAFAGLRMWPDAIAAAKKQTELLPKEPNPQDTLAEIQLSAGKLEDAEKSFQQALALEPSFSFAWQGIALARGYRGDYVGALEATAKRTKGTMNRNSKIDSEIDGAWFAASAGKMADAYAKYDAVDRDPANAAMPNYPFTSLDRGMLLQFAGRFDDSAKAFAEGLTRGEAIGGQGKRATIHRHAIGLLRAAALQGRPAADADKLVAATEDGATSPAAKSTASWARGLAAWAKTGAKAAVTELAKCEAVHIACRYDLVLAQRKAGDAAGAESTATQIRATFPRDASVVFLHAQLVGTK